jgi:hypothetical protein
MAAAPAIALHDWIASAASVRGSRPGDGGAWLAHPDPPIAWDAAAETVSCASGRRYILRPERACRALHLHERSAAVLRALPRK